MKQHKKGRNLIIDDSHKELIIKDLASSLRDAEHSLISVWCAPCPLRALRACALLYKPN